MLLDKYVLTKAFENLLSQHGPLSSGASQTPSASFIKRVNSTMTRIDPLLKTLQVRPSPPEGLVQAYLIHIGDRSDTNFRKILELKGIRKQDQPHLVELFGIHRDSAPSSGGNKLVAQSPLLTPLLNPSSLGSSSLVGLGLNPATSATTYATPTRFDPTSLGEKLLSAARDGVERMGTPNPLVQGPGGAGSAAGGQNASINENLRNFGKFFRRDIAISGLGARFGKRDVSGSGPGVE
jgi:vacuolar protein sorting-associated protein 53